MKESQHIEWKRTWGDVYLKWICGFANADGGVLVIGKDDRGNVVGLSNAKKLLVDIPNKVRDLLGSTKQELKGAALDRFLLHKQGRHWDGVPVPGFSLDDLSVQALALFRKLAAKSGRLTDDLLGEPDGVLIDKLRLVEDDYLKRAAVLLFGNDPDRLITGAYVKIGFFRTDSDLLYHDEIHGNLFAQVEKTLDLLLTKYLKAGISYEGLQRFETFPVPENALREAVINAIAHKDYAAANPIQISVYNDKLMLWNAGHQAHHRCLPRAWLPGS